MKLQVGGDEIQLCGKEAFELEHDQSPAKPRECLMSKENKQTFI